MRKPVLILLLVVVSSSATSEWVEIGKTDAYIYYVDPATIRRNGELVKMWSLLDFKIARPWQGKSFVSQRYQPRPTRPTGSDQRGQVLQHSIHFRFTALLTVA